MNVHFDRDGVSTITLTKAEQRGLERSRDLCRKLAKIDDDPDADKAANYLGEVLVTYGKEEPEPAEKSAERGAKAGA